MDEALLLAANADTALLQAIRRMLLTDIEVLETQVRARKTLAHEIAKRIELAQCEEKPARMRA